MMRETNPETDDEDGNPLCDVNGLCEPLPEEEHQASAMCRFCGGTRYKDHPTPGNWGIKP